MSDTGQDIEVGNSIKLSDLQALVDDSNNRIQILEITGARALIVYRNFYKKDNKRVKNSNKEWKLNPQVRKWVTVT